MNEGQELPTPRSFDDLRADALEEVREMYEDVARLRKLKLETINRVHHPSTRYRSMDEFTREQFARATAVSSFAVRLGLVTPLEARQIDLDFSDAHPEFAAEGWGPGPPSSETVSDPSDA